MLFRVVTELKRKFWMLHYIKIHFAEIGRNTVIDNRVSFLGEKFITIGDSCFIGADSTIQCFDCYSSKKYAPNVRIGNNVSFTRRTTIYCAERIEIGDDTMIGSDVLITDENHGTDPLHTYRANPLMTKPVIIGKNVWVGDKVIILPGVTIGDNAIIGAGSVVTKSIPPYTICAGNPARVIKTWNSESKTWETIQ